MNVINHNFQISYANYVQMHMICKFSNIHLKIVVIDAQNRDNCVQWMANELRHLAIFINHLMNCYIAVASKQLSDSICL